MQPDRLFNAREPVSLMVFITEKINLTVFFAANFSLFDTYFDATVMTGNMQLFISAPIVVLFEI